MNYLYWISRYYKNRLKFIFNKNSYYLQNDIHTAVNEWVKTLISFFWSTLKYLVIVLLIFLIFNDKDLLINLGVWLESLLLKVNQDIQVDLPTLAIEIDNFKTYLSISIAFIGVLLGLYFTSITSVFTSAFSKADGSIKQIFIDNPHINRYTAFLAFSLGHSIISYVAISNTIGVSQLNIYFNILISIFSVYAFFKLSKEVFSFFDIITLLNNPLERFESITKKATISGYKYNDPNFQNYQHIQASIEIKKVVLLKDYLLENYKDDVSKSKFLQRLYRELINYLNVHKSQIPIDSLWFEKVELHKKWFLTDITNKELALNLGTQLIPEKITEYDWVEKRLYPIIISVLEKITDNKIFLESLLILGHLSWSSGYFQNSIEIKAFLNSILLNINKRILSDDSPNLQIQFGDTYAYVVINHFVGFINMVNDFDFEKLSKELADMVRNQDGIIPSKHIPLPLQTKILDISKKIAFEYDSNIEISTKNFVQMQIKIAFVENILDYFDVFTGKTIDTLLSNSKQFIKNKQYYLAAQINLRTYEFVHKVQALMNKIDQLLEDTKALEINIVLINRYKTRKNSFVSKQNDIRDIFLLVMPHLRYLEDKKIPDIYGHIFHILYFDAEVLLRSKKTEEFRKALNVLFHASKELLNANIKDVLEINPNINVNYLNFIATQPLFDLLELSGYAKIYSELYDQEDLWRACLEEWENNSLNPDNFTNLWKSVYMLKNRLYPIHERDMLRHSWQMNLRNKFIEEGVIKENVNYGYYSSPLPIHKSKLIVYLANYTISFDKGSDIFMIYCGWWDDKSLEEINIRLPEIKESIERYEEK